MPQRLIPLPAGRFCPLPLETLRGVNYLDIKLHLVFKKKEKFKKSLSSHRKLEMAIVIRKSLKKCNEI
jgi:hypothetical protein